MNKAREDHRQHFVYHIVLPFITCVRFSSYVLDFMDLIKNKFSPNSPAKKFLENTQNLPISLPLLYASSPNPLPELPGL